MDDTTQQTRDKIQDVLTNIDEPGGEAGVLIGLARERLNSALMILDAAIKAEGSVEVTEAIETAQAEEAPAEASTDEPV